MAPSTTITDDTVVGPHGPVPVRRYSPAAASSPRLLWVHGGAFVSGGLDQRESHEVALALSALGTPVTTVDYRLASTRLSRLLRGGSGPDVRYPVPADDVLAVARHEVRAGPLVVGGASAGAALAASAALALADAGTPAAGALLAYGILHAALPAASPEARRSIRRRGLRRALHAPMTVRLMNRHYAGERMRERAAFPGGHPLDGFPDALVLDADRDVMRASGTAFAEELAAAGVPVEHRVALGASHAFLHRPRDSAFAPSIALMAGWLQER